MEAASTGAAGAVGPAARARPNTRAAAGARLEDAFMRVIGLVSAVGFGFEAWRCRHLCRETFRVHQRGDVADMLRGGLAVHGVAAKLAAARAAPRAALADGALPSYYGRGGWSQTTQLMRAASDGDEPRVRELLALGAAVDAVNDAGASALSVAAFEDNVGVARLLLEAGARAHRRGADRTYAPAEFAYSDEMRALLL